MRWCVVAAVRALPLVVGLLLPGLLGGCLSTRLAPEDLPEVPIAFVHWEDKSATKRGEILASAAEGPPVPPDSDDPDRMEEMQIRAYLRGDETPVMRGKLAKHPGRLMLIWPRTGEIERIEAAPLDSLPLAWSGDRKRLLIASTHRGGREQLYEYHLERRDLAPVTLGPEEHPRGDYVDADPSTLVVQRVDRPRPLGHSENTLHRSDRAGRLGPPLARGVPPGTVRADPAGGFVVYEQVRPRPRRNGPTVLESSIAVVDLERGAEEQILLPGREPTLTPDGAWIVFASRSSAGYRLRRMRPDGTTRVPIGPGGTEERMPSVSPDGEFIVFVQRANGRRRLVVRRFDGKEERVLLSSGWSEFPVW